eukprot:11223258-Lingulodinium_polyedra.AAC.1
MLEGAVCGGKRLLGARGRKERPWQEWSGLTLDDGRMESGRFVLVYRVVELDEVFLGAVAVEGAAPRNT